MTDPDPAVGAALLPGAAPAATGDGPEVPSGEAPRTALPLAYTQQCARCHGDNGSGDGPDAKTMFPRPRVFADNADYKFRSTPGGALPTRADLLRVIENGIPGTAMPGFAWLPAEDRDALLDLIEGWCDDFSDPDYAADRVPIAIDRPPPRTPERIARGAEIFRQSGCPACHGVEGRGDGATWFQLKDSWGDPAIPANLHRTEELRNGSTVEDLYRTTLTGLNGTPMPVTEMSAEDRWALAHWLRSLQDAPAPPQGTQLVATPVDVLPAGVLDPIWSRVQAVSIRLAAQLRDEPRLLWPSVTRITVQLATLGDKLALRLAWDDRDHNENASGEGFPREASAITEIFTQTKFPDRVAIAFAAANETASRQTPASLFGGPLEPVLTWSWRSTQPSFVAGKTLGTPSIVNPSPIASSEVRYQSGRYLAYVAHTLPIPRSGAASTLSPIAFQAWQGSRGEVDARRAVSSWYTLVRTIPRTHSWLCPISLAGGVVVLLTLGVGLALRRRRRSSRR